MADTVQAHFNSVLKNGLARSNRFKVTIELPSKLTSGNQSSQTTKDTLLTKAIKVVTRIISAYNGSTVRGLSMMCDQTEIPGRNLITSETSYNGDLMKVVYGTLYGMQPFTFHVSRDMYEKTIIDKWQELAYDPINHTSSYLDDYTANITIDVLDQADSVVYTVKLKNAFPINCNPITVSNSERDSLIPLMVTFAYKRWVRPDQEQSDNGLLSSLSQTPFGPYVTPFLSNPVVKEATDWLKDSGIDLEGEAMNIYNMVDGVVKNTTGQSITKSTTMLNGIMASVQTNGKITDEQKGGLIRGIREAISILGKG